VKASTKEFFNPRQITDLGDSWNCNLIGPIAEEVKASQRCGKVVAEVSLGEDGLDLAV